MGRPRRARTPVLFAALCGGVLLAACGGPAALGSFRSFPKVSGTFGTSPTISFPHTKPPATLTAHVLQQGHGPLVQKGQLLVANYVGQIWRGKVFDSSFSRDVPSAFPIGVGGVIPGWDKTLVHQHLDTRVLLLIPPVDGYGAKGESQAGITGHDTLAFVVDLLGAFGKSSLGPGSATPLQAEAAGVTVDWGSHGPPTVTLAHPFATVKTASLHVLARGTGPKVTPGLVVLQFVVVDTKTGAVNESTWKSGIPDNENIGGQAQASILDKLEGFPTGSRVVFLLPKSAQNDAVVIVADVVASFPLDNG